MYYTILSRYKQVLYWMVSYHSCNCKSHSRMKTGFWDGLKVKSVTYRLSHQNTNIKRILCMNNIHWSIHPSINPITTLYTINPSIHLVLYLLEQTTIEYMAHWMDQWILIIRITKDICSNTYRYSFWIRFIIHVASILSSLMHKIHTKHWRTVLHKPCVYRSWSESPKAGQHIDIFRCYHDNIKNHDDFSHDNRIMFFSLSPIPEPKVHMYMYMYIRAGIRFKCSNLHLFAVHSKLNFSLCSFAATATLMFAHAYICTI